MGAPRIVVGVDGSAASLVALGWAATYADQVGGMVEAVTAWEWPSGYGWALPLPEGFDPAADAQKVLDEAVEAARHDHPTVEVMPRVLEGHPAEVLVDLSQGAELLVVGSRGHGAFTGMLIGSVSEHCVAHAHCPVVVHRGAEPD